MTVRVSVFGSGEERENYYRLDRQWGDDWRLYHNLPFLLVFDLDQLTDSLSGRDQARLKKTSIDYTLCDGDDRPVLSVELDGLGQGFNLGDEYHVPRHAPAPTPWREEIMGLKLRVAHSAGFPFFVVGSRYFEDVTDDLRLTLVDGIIGAVLANREADRRVSEYLSGVELPEEGRYRAEAMDSIQDTLIGIEVQAEIDRNPLARERWKRAVDVDLPSWQKEFLHDPALPEIRSLKTLPEDIEARMEAMERVRLVGTKVTLLETEFGSTSASAWIPNFDTPGFDALGSDLTTHVAFLLACDQLERRRDKA